MTAGYCRHDWTSCSETLRAAFPSHSGIERAFRVCKLCLRLEEEAPQPANAAPFEPPVSKKVKGDSGEGDEQAA